MELTTWTVRSKGWYTGVGWKNGTNDVSVGVWTINPVCFPKTPTLLDVEVVRS